MVFGRLFPLAVVFLQSGIVVQMERRLFIGFLHDKILNGSWSFQQLALRARSFRGGTVAVRGVKTSLGFF